MLRAQIQWHWSLYARFFFLQVTKSNWNRWQSDWIKWIDEFTLSVFTPLQADTIGYQILIFSLLTREKKLTQTNTWTNQSINLINNLLTGTINGTYPINESHPHEENQKGKKMHVNLCILWHKICTVLIDDKLLSFALLFILSHRFVRMCKFLFGICFEFIRIIII